MSNQFEDLISRVILFENLQYDDIKSIASISKQVKVNKKEHIFYGEEQGENIYILITGAIKLYNISKAGKEVVVKVVKQGELFGEVILFEENNYPVSSVAIKDSYCLEISKADFLELLKRESFRNSFMAQIMKKLRYLKQQTHYLSDYDVEDRLILFLHEHYGGCNKEFTLDIAKKEIALAIGTTSETLSRTIKRLDSAGKISWKGKKIRINKSLCNEKCDVLFSS